MIGPMPGPDWETELRQAMENAELEVGRKDAMAPLLQVAVLCTQFRTALIRGGWSDAGAEQIVTSWFLLTTKGFKP